jgi:hypothetical protein
LLLAFGTTLLAADKAAPASAAKHPAAKEHKPQPAFNDPAEAGPDFLLQGEYAATNFGMQIVARGHGKFHSVGYQGGLPGAGWDGSPRREGDGEVKDGTVAFVDAKGKTVAVLAAETVTLKDESGATTGTLKKVTRKSPTLGAVPPAGAVVLFDGTSPDQWLNGKMTPDHLLMEGPTSKQKFGDATFHLEFRLPFMPFSMGQGRANSGFYVQGRYEVQILDSFGLKEVDNECGGIYHTAKPLVSMNFPPLAWQTYDVDFTAPRFKNGEKVECARITVKHNGVVVQDNLKIPGPTPGGVAKGEAETGPIYLQNHGNPVRFRNVWLVEKK